MSFLFKAESYSMGRIVHILLIHSSSDGHLGCSHLLAVVNLTISLNSSFLLVPSLPSMNVPAIVSNQPQPSLPWSFHPYLLLTLSSKLLPLPSFPHLPLTFHLRQASPSASLLKLLPKSHRLPYLGSFSQVLSCLQCWVLLTTSSAPRPGLCDSAFAQLSYVFLAFHQLFYGSPLTYRGFLAFIS